MSRRAAACCWPAAAGCGLLQLAGDGGDAAVAEGCGTRGKEGVRQGPAAAAQGGGRGRGRGGSPWSRKGTGEASRRQLAVPVAAVGHPRSIEREGVRDV